MYMKFLKFFDIERQMKKRKQIENELDLEKEILYI